MYPSTSQWRSPFFALIIAMLVAGLAAACTGEQGPAGQQGPQGSQGPAGSQGAPGSITFDDAPELVDLIRAMAATAPYLDGKKALEAGYKAGRNCVTTPGGAMGLHYTNPSFREDTIIDPTKPETLTYLPTESGLQLLTVEYAVNDVGQGTPSMFGQPFEGPMDPHGPPGTTGPQHYDLHVAVWTPNPAGLFEGSYPNLECPE